MIRRRIVGKRPASALSLPDFPAKKNAVGSRAPVVSHSENELGLADAAANPSAQKVDLVDETLAKLGMPPREEKDDTRDNALLSPCSRELGMVADDVPVTPRKEGAECTKEVDESPEKGVKISKDDKTFATLSSPPQGVKARLDWRKSDLRFKRELELMRDLRRNRDAPVDMLFTPSIADDSASLDTKGFHVFVAVFLSSQTRDEVTAAAMQRLKAGVGGLTIQSVAAARAKTLAKLLSPVAFHNTKAKHLKEIVRSLMRDYGGKVPVDADDLCDLPGIGPKMAHIIVSILTGHPQGIGIDVHVHRIANKLGWVCSKDPEGTRLQLQNMLPYQEWSDVNVVMVGLGQQMNSARPKIFQRCLQLPDPLSGLRLLRKLDFNFQIPDKSTGQGTLHWAASCGSVVAVKMLLEHVKPVKDNSGLWPWDVAIGETAPLFSKAMASRP